MGILDRLLAGFEHARNAGKHEAQREAVMVGAAVRLNATYSIKNDRFVLSRNGVDLEWTFVQSAGSIQRLIWRVTAPAPGFPTFGRVDAVPEPDIVKAILTPEVRDRVARLRWLEVWCEANRLTARMSPRFLSQHLIDDSCELIWDLIASDPYATSLLRTLGAYHATELPYVVVAGATEVRVGYARIDQRIVHEARAHVTATEAMVEQARALGAETVADGNDLVLRFPRVIRERELLLRAVTLLRGVPAEGVFR